MAGRGDPPPSAAPELPNITPETYTTHLQYMASQAVAGHGGHGGARRGSVLGLGGGGRGSATGTGSQGRGARRAQAGGLGLGDGPPLGSGRAGEATGQGSGAQHGAAVDLPDKFAEAHAAQLQYMASRLAAGHGVHGGAGHGSVLDLGGGGNGSSRSSGSQGKGRGRAQGGGRGLRDEPPLGSRRAGKATGQGGGGQHDDAGDPSQQLRPPRPATTNQSRKDWTEGGQDAAASDPSHLLCPPRPTMANQTKKKGIEGDSMDWNDENISLVCKLFAQQVLRGSRPNTHLNAVGYDEMIEVFKQAKGIELTRLQLKNKWDK